MIRRCAAALLLLATLAACTITTPLPATATEMPTVMATIPEGETMMAPPLKIEPPSPTRTAKPTRTSVPTATFTPTPGPLSAHGPWLVISIAGEPYIITQRFVTNSDGTNTQPIGLSSIPADRYWNFLGHNRGGYQVFRTLPREGAGAPWNLRPDGIDDRLFVLKLPENRVVRQLSLLSEAAWQRIEEAKKSAPDDFSSGYGVPPALGLIVNTDSYEWSPSGRYLTYTASLEGEGVDLYLYDIQTDETRRLTYGRTGAQIWYWSPDEQTLIYRNRQTTYAEFYAPDLAEMDAVYALDLFNGEKKLYDPETSECVYGVTNHSFLVSDCGFEGDPWNLRLVDFSHGTVQPLYQKVFSDAAMDTTGENILIYFDPDPPFSKPSPDVSPGIYRVDLSTGQLHYLRDGGKWRIGYQEEMTSFYFLEDDASNQSTTVFFDLTGNETMRFPGSNEVSPSPGGQWILAGNDDRWGLYSRDGKLIMEVYGSGSVEWHQDSTGFYWKEFEEPTFQFYEKSNGWQPKTIYEGTFESWTIIPGAGN